MTEALPLEGIKVADFSWVIAGPLATRYFATYGATVVKIESHARLDSARMGPPFIGKPSRNSSAMFVNGSPSKLSFGLNLGVPESREIAKRLATWADVVVENFSVGQMAEWGLDYESLRAANPRLVMLSSSQQGQKGPHAPHPGLGNLLQGLAGIHHLTGWPDRGPRGPKLPLPDVIAPPFTVIAILAALDYRDRTGRGQYLDLSQLEVSLQGLGPQILDFEVNRRDGNRRGNFAEEAAPHNAYPCAGDDRWCAISVRSDQEWDGLVSALGNPEWASEARFATLLRRQRNAEDLDRYIAEWTMSRSAEDAMGILQSFDVPAGVVATNRDLHEDPHLKARDHYTVLEHPGRGSHAYDYPAFRITEVAPELRRAPDLGEHNETVCRDVLDMSAEEYQGLIDVGAFS